MNRVPLLLTCDSLFKVSRLVYNSIFEETNGCKDCPNIPVNRVYLNKKGVWERGWGQTQGSNKGTTLVHDEQGVGASSRINDVQGGRHRGP